MLRASRLVRAAAPARGYATAADSFASKTTVFESVKPTASVTFLLKTGARYEQKPGTAHVLSNFAFTVSVFATYALLLEMEWRNCTRVGESWRDPEWAGRRIIATEG